MNLAEPTFWDKLYVDVPLSIAKERNPVRKWIEQWVELGSGSCLEIGCFPGRYLAVFGEMGYRLSGIDMASRVHEELPEWLAARGYQIGEFFREDFLNFVPRTEKNFDIVCSFGFIEHFLNWQEVVEKHAGLVKEGGLLIVSVPNFRGMLQRCLHRALDPDNLARHNVAAMLPCQWAALLSQMGFEVCFSGSFGRFDFWVDSPLRKGWQRAGYRGVRALMPFLRKLPVSSFYAPHCGIIARKIER